MSCWEGSSRVLWVLGALVVLVVTLVGPVWLIVRAKGDRRAALAVWAAALPLAPLALWVNAASDEPLDAEVAFGVGVGLGALIGLAVGLVRRRPARLTLLGAIGGAGLVAAAAALFVGSLAATGSCLD